MERKQLKQQIIIPDFYCLFLIFNKYIFSYMYFMYKSRCVFLLLLTIQLNLIIPFLKPEIMIYHFQTLYSHVWLNMTADIR